MSKNARFSTDFGMKTSILLKEIVSWKGKCTLVILLSEQLQWQWSVSLAIDFEIAWFAQNEETP